MCKQLFFGLVFVCVSSIYGQQSATKSVFSLSQIGIQFIQGNEQNILFDDPDYFYRTNVIKGQLHFPLTTVRKTTLSLVLQPQIQFAKHQLYNKYFVTPDETNYLDKQQQFTQLKNLTLLSLEVGLAAKKKVLNTLSLYAQIGLGFSFINTESERLAKGFTFIENVDLGLEYTINNTSSFQLFTGFGHVSNFNTKQPNSGYNIINTGIGYLYKLK